MNPKAAETSSQQPRFFSGIKKVGAMIGIQTVPPDTSTPQASVPPAVENAFQNAPEGAPDPTKSAAPAVSTETPSNITAEPPTIVPAEPVAQVPVAEVSMGSAVPASNPPEDPNSSAPPVDKKEEEEPSSETTDPAISEPSPQEPVVQAETVVPVENAAQVPAESAVPSMDFNHEDAVVSDTDINKKEESTSEIPEDPIATEVVRDYSEKFIHDGVLDMKGLQAAIEEARIAKNPQAQKAVSQLHSIGVVNPEVISKVLKPILAKAA